jgi:hypothetical protein
MATPGSAARLRAVSAATVAILAATWAETFQARDVWKSMVDYTKQGRRPG